MPVLLMAQNKQEQEDRKLLRKDIVLAETTEERVMEIQAELDAIEDRIIALAAMLAERRTNGKEPVPSGPDARRPP